MFQGTGGWGNVGWWKFNKCKPGRRCQQRICLRCFWVFDGLNIWGLRWFKHLGLHTSSRRCSRCRTCCSRGNRTSTHTRAPGRDWSWLSLYRHCWQVGRRGQDYWQVGRLWDKRTGSYFLGQLADLGLCVKHVALGTTKLVWLLKRAPSVSRTMLSIRTFTCTRTILQGVFLHWYPP